LDNFLEDLKQKQRKLIFHFGEMIYGSLKSERIELAFPGEHSSEEKETVKLLKLLRYMEERIRKFERTAAGREETDAKETRSGACEISVENPLTEQAKDAVSAACPGRADVPCEKCEECPPAEAACVAPVAEEVAPQTEPAAGEALPEIKPDAERTPVEEFQTVEPQTQSHTASDEAPQPVTATPVLDEMAGVKNSPPAADPFGDILTAAALGSETERRVFEETVDVLRFGDEKDRERAVKSVSHFGGKETFLAICRVMMKDPAAPVRTAVIKAIARIRDAGVAEIYQQGLDDEDAGVRIAAVKGLSMALPKDSVSSIIPLLRDPDAHVRGMAVTCLGIYGGEAGAQAVFELRGDPDAYVRKSLVDVFGIVRAPGMLPTIKMMVDDENEVVRKAVESALSKAKVEEEALS
jgi:hypothetical protein